MARYFFSLMYICSIAAYFAIKSRSPPIRYPSDEPLPVEPTKFSDFLPIIQVCIFGFLAILAVTLDIIRNSLVYYCDEVINLNTFL